MIQCVIVATSGFWVQTSGIFKIGNQRFETLSLKKNEYKVIGVKMNFSKMDI